MAIECPRCHFANAEGSRFCRKCAAPLPLAEAISAVPTGTWEKGTDELTRGTVFAGRYEVIEELGRGGMGRVYRVEDKKVNEEVVLKFLKPEIASDKGTIERFRNELKLARRVSHKNVCRMYDLNEEKGTHYISMEYVAGEDLGGMVRMTRQLSVGTAVGIAKQVCEGLAEAHRLGVVHRDLKSSNIMIDRSGNARIMDFGIARSLETKGLTGAGVMIGTPEYMSPEQVEGEADERSDIYSLGVIMYEMVTGRVPFEGDTPLGVAVKQKTGVVREPREINAGVPEELSRVIMKCLEKERRKRYQSAEEVYKDLDRIEEGLSTAERVIARPRTVTSITIRETFKKRWGLIALLIGLVIIIGLGILYIKSRSPVSPARMKMIVVLPFENLGPAEDEYFADGITEEVTNRLSALHGLGVISRTSAVQYKKTNKTIKEIGRELGVEYVLEGTIRWDRSQEDQGRVRITPQLIRVSDDTHLWAEPYDRVLSDIFSIQSDIAEQIAKQLDIRVLEPDRKALYERPTQNLRAYDFYLQALEQYRKAYYAQDIEEHDKAVELLERAVELDGRFTFAYIYLSSVHSFVYEMGLDRIEARRLKSLDALNKALELQPDLPEVQLELGIYCMRVSTDYDRALEIFKSVEKARPNRPSTFLGDIYRRKGNWQEAIMNYENAFRLNPRSSGAAHMLGRVYAWIGRYDKSEEWFDRALSIYPDLYYSKLGNARLPLLSRGDVKQARILLEALPQHVLTDYNWYLLCMLERSYEELLDRLASSPHDSFFEAQFYIPKDLAFASVYYQIKDLPKMKTHAESARNLLEKEISENPDDPRLHASLGLAYAFLDRKDDAVREGKRAVEIYPVSRDAFEAPRHILNLAVIYSVVGEYDEAIEQLEYLLSIPCGNNYSVSMLRLNPVWDPLRENPRFQRLLRERPERKLPG